MSFFSSLGGALGSLGYGAPSHPSGSTDPWFVQFHPENASPSSPAGGGGTMGTVANGGIQQNGGLPGDPNLPGYGDWNTSNPWRDSLSYEDMKMAPGYTPIASAMPAASANSPVGGNGMVGGMINKALQPLPDYGSLYGSLSQLGGRGMLGGLVQKSLGTGMDDQNSGIYKAYAGAQAKQQALANILTPSGKRMAIPMEHLQEAIRRGARHLGGQ